MLDVKTLNNNSEILKNEFLLYLKDYLSKVHLPEQVISAIIDSSFIEKNPIYYTYYPFLFVDAIGVTDIEKVKLLNIAGFLYYKSILTIDEIFDNKNSKSFEKYMIANFCQEEAIKILSLLFSEKPSFWKYWNLRKSEYIKAYKFDKSTKNIVDFDFFEQLADYKCAFGKIAIDSLFILHEDKNDVTYEELLTSHKYFYTAFQILDDLKDIEEDLNNDQFNIAYYSLVDKFPNEDFSTLDSRTIRTRIYLDGIAEKLYNKAFEYIQKSKHEVIHLTNIDQWLYEIQSLNNTIVKGNLNIDGFINVFKVNNLLSKEKVFDNSFETALERSKLFIEKNQYENGYWRDYFNDGGVSDEWCTGFVLSNCAKDLSTENVERAINNLKSNFEHHSLFGYNSKWISDADSTTFAFLALRQVGLEIPNTAIEEWLKFQNPDGGFRTYYSEKEVIISLQSPHIKEAKGWMESHFCVSAVAYYFLCLNTTSNSNYRYLREYIFDSLQYYNIDLCYWWTHSLYGLLYIYKGATLNNDNEILSLLDNIIDKIIKNEDDILSNSIFYQSHLIEIICNSSILFEKYENSIRQKIEFLLEQQYSDGSWVSKESMRIPHPNNRKANIKSDEWPSKDSGTNILVKDFHRIFSTVACYKALLSYQFALTTTTLGIQYNH